jgi:hypothetical protein
VLCTLKLGNLRRRGPSPALRKASMQTMLCRSDPEYQKLGSGVCIPLIVAYSRAKRVLATSGHDIEKAPSHDAAVATAKAFFDMHTTRGTPNPLACPYVQCASHPLRASGCPLHKYRPEWQGHSRRLQPSSVLHHVLLAQQALHTPA